MAGQLDSKTGFVISSSSNICFNGEDYSGKRLKAAWTPATPFPQNDDVRDDHTFAVSAVGAASFQSGYEAAADPLKFRGYQLIPAARLLLLNGQPVKIGSRAFDLLQVLLHSRGKLVSKGKIVSHVWPDTTVEESNLRFQMGCLRKALGADRDLIITIPGRGYLFAADLPSSALQTSATDAHIVDAQADCQLADA